MLNPKTNVGKLKKWCLHYLVICNSGSTIASDLVKVLSCWCVHIICPKCVKNVFFIKC